MREIEIKTHVPDASSLLAELERRYGKGREVHKRDHYFHLPGEVLQSLRIRNNNGKLEFTTKHSSNDGKSENNEEFEFFASEEEYERAVAFFHALGHEDYFVKIKDGWEWYDGEVHIEVFQVNDLGYFMEIEILIPFDASNAFVEEKREKIASLVRSLGLENEIENRSYREMILERRTYGMES